MKKKSIVNFMIFFNYNKLYLFFYHFQLQDYLINLKLVLK
jgi:hypothetical protein